MTTAALAPAPSAPGLTRRCSTWLWRRGAWLTLLLLLPPLLYSVAEYAAPFPGTVSLRSSTATAVVADIAASLTTHGFRYLALANALAPYGFTYAPDPSSQQTSSIGGNVATNAGGPHCLAYGVTADHVLALDVVLPDGSVQRIGSEGPEAAGYDLRSVVIGSEGTLGLVAAVCVRLTPLPPTVRTMLFDFEAVADCAA